MGMPEALEQLRKHFRLVYIKMRNGEAEASNFYPGHEEHRRVMLEVFEAEDDLFEIATLMFSLQRS